MLTSSYVVSTSFLVSSSAVSCYSASMVNLIWFTDEKCSPVKHFVSFLFAFTINEALSY